MEKRILLDKNLLKSVSRSFYTSLQVLPATLRPSMGLAYLICRTADTLADTNLLPPENRLPALQQFRRLFEQFPPLLDLAKNVVADISEKMTAGPAAETALITSFEKTYACYAALPHTDQALINDVARSVIDGMMFDLEYFGVLEGAPKALDSDADLDRYITLIGGEPGRFWTRSCLEHIPTIRILDRAAWIHEGISLGKGLQMVNILRDLPHDLQIGRCYLPNNRLATAQLRAEDLLNQDAAAAFLPLYHQLIDETLDHLRLGLSYIKRLPPYAWRLRAAAWWPLLFGLRTLALLRNEANILNPERRVKLTRSDVLREMIFCWGKLPFDRVLNADFQFWAKKARSQID